METKNNHKNSIIKAIISILFGFAFLISIIIRDKIYSRNDLIEISLTINDFKFTEHKSFRRDSYDYHILVNEYENTFRIFDEFIGYFNKDVFEQKIRTGSNIKIELSKKAFENISAHKTIEIFGLSDENNVYLNHDKTIRAHNTQGPAFAGVFFLIVGVIILFSNIKI